MGIIFGKSYEENKVAENSSYDFPYKFPIGLYGKVSMRLYGANAQYQL
jgi:hypothetical protein